MQRLLRDAVWDAEKVRDDLRSLSVVSQSSMLCGFYVAAPDSAVGASMRLNDEE
jgi:hypothetical protein